MMAEKRLVLGSALWGWGIDRNQVFELLDLFVERGGVWVDTAVNYPINKRPEDHGKAVQWLGEWVEQRGHDDLAILLKVGGRDNLGSAESLLTPEHVAAEMKRARQRFGRSLKAVAIHWDNRGDEPGDRQAIRDTLGAFVELKRQGLGIGFSGIRHPGIYREEAPQLSQDWWIQVKENASTNDARVKLARFFPDAQYLAYGINMGGVKPEAARDGSSAALRGITPTDELVAKLHRQLADAAQWNPAPRDFNQLAMHQSYLNPALAGIVAGPRTAVQLESTMDYWNALAATRVAAAGPAHA